MTAGLYACKWCLCRRDADLIWIERSFSSASYFSNTTLIGCNPRDCLVQLPTFCCLLPLTKSVCKLPRVRRFILQLMVGNTLPRNFEVCCGQRVFCLIWPWPLRFCSNSVISVVVLVMANIRRTVLQRAELAKLKRRDERVRRAKCPLN